MRLTSSKSVEYFKFKDIGDTVTGAFLSFERDVAGTFGPENILTLKGAHGRIVIRATANLAAILGENASRLADRQLTITLAALKPTSKGSALKVYNVEIDDEEADESDDVRPAVADENDALPF